MEAEIIFDPQMPIALQQALDYAGDNGFVASMPQLIHAQTNACYDNIIWNTWFTANSEESIVTTPQGNHVVVAIHGGGIYGTPGRFEKMYYATQDYRNTHGFTEQYAGKISQQEARDVLEGKLPDIPSVPPTRSGAGSPADWPPPPLVCLPNRSGRRASMPPMACFIWAGPRSC